MGPSNVGDTVTLPGPLSSGCRLYSPKDLIRHSFLGHSGYMAELTQLGSLDSEKWLGIPGFTDFRPVLLVTKCHTLDSSQISHLCRLFFCQYSLSRHQRFMTTGEDRNKDRFKRWNLCGLWKHPFRHHEAIKLTQNQGQIQGEQLRRSPP